MISTHLVVHDDVHRHIHLLLARSGVGIIQKLLPVKRRLQDQADLLPCRSRQLIRQLRLPSDVRAADDRKDLEKSVLEVGFVGERGALLGEGVELSVRNKEDEFFETS
jgi:hypothetical protein